MILILSEAASMHSYKSSFFICWISACLNFCNMASYIHIDVHYAWTKSYSKKYDSYVLAKWVKMFLFYSILPDDMRVYEL